ncbi:MAG TPA: hypothetical protein DD001_02945, partial [Microcoleaceae bacterium UBA10368]|nr:hypothetical protein [Microcoleaceae cyanobacterium UBA10368]
MRKAQTVQTKPVQQKSQVLRRYAEGKTLMAHQSAEAAVSEGVIKEKERFQRLVEHSPDAVAMVDAEMRYL